MCGAEGPGTVAPIVLKQLVSEVVSGGLAQVGAVRLRSVGPLTGSKLVSGGRDAECSAIKTTDVVVATMASLMTHTLRGLGLKTSAESIPPAEGRYR
jgi:hypothetical protein